MGRTRSAGPRHVRAPRFRTPPLSCPRAHLRAAARGLPVRRLHGSRRRKPGAQHRASGSWRQGRAGASAASRPAFVFAQASCDHQGCVAASVPRAAAPTSMARASATAPPTREQTRCPPGGQLSCRQASGHAAVGSRTPPCDSDALESSGRARLAFELHREQRELRSILRQRCQGSSGGDDEPGDRATLSIGGLRSAAGASGCIAGREAQWSVVSRIRSAHMSKPPATSTRTPSQVAREVFHAIFNDRHFSDPSRYWTDQSVDHFLALGKSVRGKDALTGFFRELFAAFPDWTLDVEQTIDDGDRWVVVQWTARATFDGAPLAGHQADRQQGHRPRRRRHEPRPRRQGRPKHGLLRRNRIRPPDRDVAPRGVDGRPCGPCRLQPHHEGQAAPAQPSQLSASLSPARRHTPESVELRKTQASAPAPPDFWPRPHASASRRPVLLRIASSALALKPATLPSGARRLAATQRTQPRK